jgi:hypothetical protein
VGRRRGRPVESGEPQHNTSSTGFGEARGFAFALERRLQDGRAGIIDRRILLQALTAAIGVGEGDGLAEISLDTLRDRGVDQDACSLGAEAVGFFQA